MAGHSKWNNIKHRKAGQDARRGKIFTKIIREITIAAREGGGVIEDNPGLRNIVDKAKAVQMPKDTIERAIARGTGEGDDAELIRLTYEGYGPGGIAILVETMTDNKNRTVAEVRYAFNKGGGNLGTDGSVAYLFNRQGQIYLGSAADPDKLMEAALEAGAEDIDFDEEGIPEISTAPEELMKVKEFLRDAGYQIESAELAMVPTTLTQLDAETGEKVMNLLELLEDLDDVQNVYTNASFPEDMSG
ncbi:MAG: YebC/PmpR family DNA-binding transcriptional regulator [Gammaproteobacteria bacterium]|nr:YebC/PmpR family DNA-binding transcriptional regulator [Gammaproteobacteria bacterium]